MIPEPGAILLTKLRYVGDVLLTTPALRLLRSAYPRAHITMVVNRGTEDVLRHNPHVDRVLTVERDGSLAGRLRREWALLRGLRQVRYGLSVDFFSGDRGAYLALLSGVPRRIGFAGREGMRRWIFTRAVEVNGPIHTLERNLLLLEGALGLRAADRRLELRVGAEDEAWVAGWLAAHDVREPPVVIHPGGRHWFKRWPAEKWAALLGILLREGRGPVVLAGGAQEAADAARILAGAPPGVLSLVGGTTVLQLAALLARARLFIGNDSGPMHLAAAAGTRVIALFGPTEPEVWRPWGEGHVVISRHEACSPCAGTCERGAENCMNQISVEQVAQAVRECAARPGPRGIPAGGPVPLDKVEGR